MRKCPRCDNKVPKFVVVNGKRHNCQRRKYCFACSPFGEHNTSKLEERISLGSKAKACHDCGKIHDQKGRRCPTCNFNKRSKEVLAKVKSIVGIECWKCGYDRTWRNLAFHHVDPSTKLFGLTSRECMYQWGRVYDEMKKCILVCHNCHGEIHEGIIANDVVIDLWKQKWLNG